jgi:hypothetical protein
MTKLLAVYSKAKKKPSIDVGVCLWRMATERRKSCSHANGIQASNCLSNQLAIATVMSENEYNLTIDEQIKEI